MDVRRCISSGSAGEARPCRLGTAPRVWQSSAGTSAGIAEGYRGWGSRLGQGLIRRPGQCDACLQRAACRTCSHKHVMYGQQTCKGAVHCAPKSQQDGPTTCCTGGCSPAGGERLCVWGGRGVSQFDLSPCPLSAGDIHSRNLQRAASTALHSADNSPTYTSGTPPRPTTVFHTPADPPYCSCRQSRILPAAAGCAARPGGRPLRPLPSQCAS